MTAAGQFQAPSAVRERSGGKISSLSVYCQQPHSYPRARGAVQFTRIQ